MSVLTQTEADRIPCESLKKLSPDERLRLSEKIYFEARRLKADWLCRLCPDRSTWRVEEKARKTFLSARS